MSGIRKAQPFSLLSQGGVALADILANSVAVILILIIITLSVQQKRAEEEIKKNNDLTSILARQIATSVVFNDLPSSPPARLHDYHSCAIPHDCQPHLYPIVEMHNNHIRIFKSNTKIYRNELLRENNAFDRYLRSLNKEERLNIRLDVYSVSEYYLALGILQEHDIRPRHWHYLGEKTKPLENKLLQDETIAGIEAQESQEVDNAEGESLEGAGLEPSENQNNSQGEGDQNQQDQQLAGAELANAEMMEALQYDELLPPSKGGDAEQQPEQNTNQSGGNEQESNQKPSSLFEALVGAMAESRGLDASELTGGAGSGDSRSFNLRVPNSKSQQENGKQQGGGETITLPLEQYNRVILTYVFSMLKLAEKEQTLELRQAKELLFSITKSKDDLSNFENYALVEKLSQLYDTGVPDTYPKLNEKENLLQENNNTYLIQSNQPLPKNVLRIHQPTSWLENLKDTKSVQPSMLMRLYPSLYKGELLDFPKGYALIVHPEQFQNTHLKWRPVAILDNRLEDISMGFIYASVEDESLLIAAGPNQLALNQLPVSNPDLSKQDHRLQIIPFMWLFILVALLLFLQRIKKKTAIA